jgi:hypothetical protein
MQAQNIGALTTVHVSGVEDGTQAWVVSEKQYFTLDKFSNLLPDGINIVAPLTGSPIAGNAGARWIRSCCTFRGPGLANPVNPLQPVLGLLK